MDEAVGFRFVLGTPMINYLLGRHQQAVPLYDSDTSGAYVLGKGIISQNVAASVPKPKPGFDDLWNCVDELAAPVASPLPPAPEPAAPAPCGNNTNTVDAATDAAVAPAGDAAPAKRKPGQRGPGRKQLGLPLFKRPKESEATKTERLGRRVAEMQLKRWNRHKCKYRNKSDQDGKVVAGFVNAIASTVNSTNLRIVETSRGLAISGVSRKSRAVIKRTKLRCKAERAKRDACDLLQQVVQDQPYANQMSVEKIATMSYGPEAINQRKISARVFKCDPHQVRNAIRYSAHVFLRTQAARMKSAFNYANMFFFTDKPGSFVPCSCVCNSIRNRHHPKPHTQINIFGFFVRPSLIHCRLSLSSSRPPVRDLPVDRPFIYHTYATTLHGASPAHRNRPLELPSPAPLASHGSTTQKRLRPETDLRRTSVCCTPAPQSRRYMAVGACSGRYTGFEGRFQSIYTALCWF